MKLYGYVMLAPNSTIRIHSNHIIWNILDGYENIVCEESCDMIIKQRCSSFELEICWDVLPKVYTIKILVSLYDYVLFKSGKE